MAKRTLSSLDNLGKLSGGTTVLVRVDFNIPIEQGIEIIGSYDQRLRATLPTIRYLLDRDCKVVPCSHLGRPGGKVVEELRLGPVGDRLPTLLGRPGEKNQQEILILRQTALVRVKNHPLLLVMRAGSNPDRSIWEQVSSQFTTEHHNILGKLNIEFDITCDTRAFLTRAERYKAIRIGLALRRYDNAV